MIIIKLYDFRRLFSAQESLRDVFLRAQQNRQVVN